MFDLVSTDPGLRFDGDTPASRVRFICPHCRTGAPFGARELELALRRPVEKLPKPLRPVFAPYTVLMPRMMGFLDHLCACGTPFRFIVQSAEADGPAARITAVIEPLRPAELLRAATVTLALTPTDELDVESRAGDAGRADIPAMRGKAGNVRRSRR